MDYQDVEKVNEWATFIRLLNKFRNEGIVVGDLYTDVDIEVAIAEEFSRREVKTITGELARRRGVASSEVSDEEFYEFLDDLRGRTMELLQNYLDSSGYLRAEDVYEAVAEVLAEEG